MIENKWINEVDSYNRFNKERYRKSKFIVRIIVTIKGKEENIRKIKVEKEGLFIWKREKKKV